MSKGLWPAVSGSLAQSQRLDTVANNLANINTNGFKRDELSFKKVVTDAMKATAEEDIPRRAYKDKDFYRLDGRDQAFVVVGGMHTDHRQGMVKVTSAPLDVALEGKGFLEVLTPNGIRYTRNGNLKLNAQAVLVNQQGYPVLAGGGNPAQQQTVEELQARVISLDEVKPGELTITQNGTIYRGKEEQTNLSIVEFVDNRLLAKEGGSLFKNEIAANIKPIADATKVRQGMVETSNVNSVKELTELLKANRMFEANQKMIKNYGDLEAKAVNELGKL